MKAQSELMGDHERTAEMTVPRRKAEQQSWINEAELKRFNEEYALAQEALADFGAEVLLNSDAASIATSVEAIGCQLGAVPALTHIPAFTHDNDMNEVNHRPAGQ